MGRHKRIKNQQKGAVAGLVECPTSVGVMISQFIISQFVGSSPAWDSVLAAQSLLRILCLPLSLPLPHLHSVGLSLSLPQKYINIKKN